MIQDPTMIWFAQAISRLLGWLYFLAWSASFYPQPYLNILRQTTTGSTIDFPTINILGFTCYALSTAAFLFSGTIRRQYAERNPVSPETTVRANDFVFALHAVVLSCITLSQFWPRLWGWEGRGRQRVSPGVKGVVVGSVLGVLATVVIVRVKGADDAREGWAWIDVVYAIGYVKLIITFLKYIPQAWENYKRQSTVGWSIYQILLDLSGGIMSLTQLVIDSSLQNDWSGITGNPVKLGLSLFSMGFDGVFILQHYVLYRQKSMDGEERPLIDPDHRRDEEAMD